MKKCQIHINRCSGNDILESYVKKGGEKVFFQTRCLPKKDLIDYLQDSDHQFVAYGQVMFCENF